MGDNRGEFILVHSEISPPHTAVIVGGDNGYTVVPRDTYTYAIIIGIALVVVAIAILFIYMFTEQTNAVQVSTTNATTNYIPLVPLETVYTDFGSTSGTFFTQPSDGNAFTDATDCNANPTSTWSTLSNTCWCNPPYWGPSCDRYTYSDRYISIGIYNANTTLTEISTTPDVPILNDCIGLCDAIPSCGGVKYIDGACTPFYSVTVTPGTNIQYTLGVNEDLYMRRDITTENILYSDRVIIYQGILPLRWWLLDIFKSDNRIDGSNLLTVMLNIVYQVWFYPGYSICSNGSVTGVWSVLPFSRDDYDSLLLGGDTDQVYIHQCGTDLVVPVMWVNLPLWVMYR